jgi:hypothetical protein
MFVQSCGCFKKLRSFSGKFVKFKGRNWPTVDESSGLKDEPSGFRTGIKRDEKGWSVFKILMTCPLSEAGSQASLSVGKMI